MNMINELRKKNPDLDIKLVTDTTFTNYGKVLDKYNVAGISKYMEENTEIPPEGNIYIASDAEMEKDSVAKKFSHNMYGDMPIQIGYCNGMNSNLNGLEYHKGNEIIVAITDLVLLLGKLEDVKDNKYPADNVEAFFLPAGTVAEQYQTTLHFAPCKVTDDGFKSIIILPKGTNTPVEEVAEELSQEDRLLFAKNKWLIAHPDRKPLIEKGAFGGITGENIEVKY